MMTLWKLTRNTIQDFYPTKVYQKVKKGYSSKGYVGCEKFQIKNVKSVLKCFKNILGMLKILNPLLM